LRAEYDETRLSPSHQLRGEPPERNDDSVTIAAKITNHGIDSTATSGAPLGRQTHQYPRLRTNRSRMQNFGTPISRHDLAGGLAGGQGKDCTEKKDTIAECSHGTFFHGSSMGRRPYTSARMSWQSKSCRRGKHSLAGGARDFRQRVIALRLVNRQARRLSH